MAVEMTVEIPVLPSTVKKQLPDITGILITDSVNTGIHLIKAN
jgi:hypothetical protein